MQSHSLASPSVVEEVLKGRSLLSVASIRRASRSRETYTEQVVGEHLVAYL